VVEQVSYRDYALWQQAQADELSARSGAEFGQVLNGCAKLDLSAEYLPEAKQTDHGETIEFQLPSALREQVQSAATGLGLTEFEMLFAGYVLTLSIYANQHDFLVGIADSRRDANELADTVGVFMSMLPVRCRIQPNMPLDELASALAVGVRDARARGPLTDSVAAQLGSEFRNPGLHPYFDVAFLYQNHEGHPVQLPGSETVELAVRRQGTKYDLSLYAHPRSEGLVFGLEYCTDLFPKRFAQEFGISYLTVLDQLAKALSEASDQAQKLTWKTLQLVRNPSDRGLPGASEPLHELPTETATELVNARLREQPDRIAIGSTAGTLTCGELDRRAAGVASALGPRPGALVGVLMRRTPDLIAALLGVWRSGAAYLPLDPGYPQAWLDSVLDRSGCELVLTDLPEAPQTGSVPLLRFSDIDLENSDCVPVETGGDDLAYVIYTSGSTGVPKGVELTQRNVANFVTAMSGALGLNCDDRICCLTTVSFDIFALETWLPLSMGATVVLANETEQLDLSALGVLLRGFDANVMQATPSRLAMFLDDPSVETQLSGIRLFAIGGEPIKAEGVSRLLAFHSQPRIYNVYGPTETCVWSTCQQITTVDDLAIGREIGNTWVYVIDSQGRLCAPGSVGELCIGGLGVANGYRNDPQKTAAVFCADPFHPGFRMYHTGDLVRWNEQGELVCLGRSDNQVKIRGYRVELGMVESCLKQCEGVTGCASAVRDNRLTGATELVAFYTSGEPLAEAGLRARFEKELPGYYLPSLFVRVDRLPMTPNGKLDRKQLLADLGDTCEPTVEVAKPRIVDPRQQEVADDWSQVLAGASFGLDDSFFEVGGNSLLLVRLHHLLERRYPGRFTLADLFSHPSVRAMAQLLPAQGIEPIVAGIPLRGLHPQPGTAFRPEESLLDSVAGIPDLSSEAVFGALVFLIASMSKSRRFPIYVVSENAQVCRHDIDLRGANNLSTIRELAADQLAVHAPSVLISELLAPARRSDEAAVALCLGAQAHEQQTLFDVALGFDEQTGQLVMDTNQTCLGSGSSARLAALLSTILSAGCGTASESVG
jgi:amino acid adenylation domain-containing protein